MLEEESHSKSVGQIAHSLANDVAHGIALSTALQKYEKIVGAFYINIIIVGETSGTLPENLEYIAEELKKKHELRKQVIGALVYPLVIVISTFGITTMLIVYIFPKIMPIFLSMKAELPWSTRTLIWLSHALSTYGLFLLLGIILGSVAFSFAMRSKNFHYRVDVMLIHIPVFGKLSRFYNLANTCRTLSLLLKSDVRFVQALEIAAASLKNQAYSRALVEVGGGVLKGQRMSVQLKASPQLFPPLLTQMLSVGESTGNLSETLMYMSEMYETEIRDWTKNLTSVLEPVLMLTMGLLVGFIAVSIITPIYGITQSIHN